MSERPVVLAVGCGLKQRVEDYGLRLGGPGAPPTRADEVTLVTLDADPRVRPQIVCELGRDRIALPDDSVDLILAMHVLEHIGRQGEIEAWFHAWGELYRVAKPDARLEFECPYFSSLWAWADPTHTRAISEMTFLYLDQDAYRRPGSAIPRYRPPCDWMIVGLNLRPDVTNPEVRAREPVSFLHGVLRARKPFAPWWADQEDTKHGVVQPVAGH
jgi:SAM-dependent methyltransferase